MQCLVTLFPKIGHQVLKFLELYLSKMVTLIRIPIFVVSDLEFYKSLVKQSSGSNMATQRRECISQATQSHFIIKESFLSLELKNINKDLIFE